MCEEIYEKGLEVLECRRSLYLPFEKKISRSRDSGTLEPGEGYLDAIKRELMEEAGAVLKTFHLVGAWHCHSLADKPYRPHLPWPEFYRLLAYGEVELSEPPTNPKGRSRSPKSRFFR